MSDIGGLAEQEKHATLKDQEWRPLTWTVSTKQSEGIAHFHVV